MKAYIAIIAAETLLISTPFAQAEDKKRVNEEIFPITVLVEQIVKGVEDAKKPKRKGEKVVETVKAVEGDETIFRWFLKAALGEADL